MTLHDFATLMWFTASEVLLIPIHLFEFTFTLMQLFIFGMLVTIMLSFLLNFGSKENN